MKIRDATDKDITSIQLLHDKFILDVQRADDPEYGAMVQQRGFTVSAGGSEIAQRLRTSVLLNVAEVNDEVVGYIDMSKEEYFPEDADNIIWFNKDKKAIYYHDEYALTLHHIVTDIPGKGIATGLFENALSDLKQEGYQHVFSIVATAPLSNCASIIWHTRQGFERICTHTPIDLFGLKNYQATLFYKEM